MRASSKGVSSRWSLENLGGGSAAALSAALGCSLGLLVIGILLARPKIRPAERAQLQKNRLHLEAITFCLKGLIREDAQAYQALVAAQKSGQGLRKARRNALACPLKIVEKSYRATALLRRIAKKTGPYLGSDLEAGIALLRGASGAAQAMVEVNRK